MIDRLTKEECLALINGEHDWEDSYLIDKHGKRREDSSLLRTFKQANITYWGNLYPNVLKERITKYDTGTFCHRHRDNSWRKVKLGYRAHEVWITPLNDDYEGGDLYFGADLINQEVGVPIKRDKNIPHLVTKITKGTRYSLVSWSFRND